MDHRISKDMISSGMSYTGKKSQSDLGRTYYGSAARPDTLMEAYTSMYKKEKIQEAGGPALPGEPGKPGTPKAPGGRPHLPGEKQTPLPKKPGASLQLAHADLFDIIKGHLMDEGLTEAAAIEMMVSMTEEERDAIIEQQYTVNVADIKGGTQAAKNAQSGMKNKVTGQPLYKPGVGVTPDFKLKGV